MLDLAENALVHVDIGPGFERVEADGYWLFCGPERHPHVANVQRQRLAGRALAAVLAGVGAWFAERGRPEYPWWVGASAEPADLVEQLPARGAAPDPDGEIVTAMVLDTEPP